MERYVCIHGHFYQPPRENPWLEEIELQDSAHPFHDWNERISAECYGPNAHSRILGPDGKIVDLVSNYSRMSFNFGATLLSWLERQDPDTYEAIIAADRASRERFSGHGSALAQGYGHIIMPLATRRDKVTQVYWGMRDFEHRFGRAPEGMWLPETAVDLETLEIMADHGIRFTLLAPGQASSIRLEEGGEWHDVTGGSVDPRYPYRLVLPSGREMALFFYDGGIAHDVAFGDILRNGERFAHRLVSAFDEEGPPQLVHVATDGESYGHHHRAGDMALAYCLRHIQEQHLATITIYGEYLEKVPPVREARIVERTSWSCAHGVERWRSDCGCSAGAPGWHQGWRAPLRGALDWLRDTLSRVYEDAMGEYADDPWAARDRYIEVVLRRGHRWPEADLRHVTGRTPETRVRILQLLEMQRNALLMYTSCGWFFDEVSGLETTQVIAYAARAIQLASQVVGMSAETTFLKLLERTPSNIVEYGNAAYVYRNFVKPSVLDIVKVGAHFAVSSVFEDYRDTATVYCFDVDVRSFEREEAGRHRLATGEVLIRSRVTEEERLLGFTVVYLGEYNLTGGVRELKASGELSAAREKITEAFRRSDPGAAIGLMTEHFGEGTYTLWDLFRDEQRHVLSNLLSATLDDVEITLRQVKDHHYSLLSVLRQRGVPLPKILSRVVESICEADLLRGMDEGEEGLSRIRDAVAESRRWSLSLDRTVVGFAASRTINRLMARLEEAPDDNEVLLLAGEILEAVVPLDLRLDIWQAQNICFVLARRLRPGKKDRARWGSDEAETWVERFDKLATLLGVRVA
jgi:alpha-amylase/alpha-mannosidase (GH57 family)